MEDLFIKITNGELDGLPFLLDNLVQVGIDPRANDDWFPVVPKIVQASESLQPGQQTLVINGEAVEMRTAVPYDPDAVDQPIDELPGSEPDVI